MAKRTERLYDEIEKKPKFTILSRLKISFAMGTYLGYLIAWIVVLDYIMSFVWDFLLQIDSIESVEDFDY